MASNQNRTMQSPRDAMSQGSVVAPSWYDNQDNSSRGGSQKQTSRTEHNSGSSDPAAIRANRGQVTDQTQMVGRKIQLARDIATIRGDFYCQGVHLLVMEYSRSIIGFSGFCPLCGTKHFDLPDDRSYYAVFEKVVTAFATQRDVAEREMGPPNIRDLPSSKDELPPLDKPILGTPKGIEGDSNSCYMDATIFCMFPYSGIFDKLLHMKVDQNIKQLQTILRENVVNMLRGGSGSVNRHAMYYLRKELSEVTGDRSFLNSEKDPSEFLKTFENLFRFEPIKIIHPDQAPKANLSNVTHNILWEMFDMNPHNVLSTHIADMFRNSLAEIPARLVTVPPVLILIAPRHGRGKRTYPYIYPDRQIVLDNDSLQLVCQMCKKTNPRAQKITDFYSCDTCQSKTSTTSTDAMIECYCQGCMKKNHDGLSSAALQEHSVKKVDASKNKLNLFAVLCIETSHYVAFVKCKTRQNDEQWLFFDSMSDRINDQTNIPSVSRVPDFDRWLDEPLRNKYFFEDLHQLVQDPRPMVKKFNENEMRRLRLFRDGAFFFYENASANYQ